MYRCLVHEKNYSLAEGNCVECKQISFMDNKRKREAEDEDNRDRLEKVQKQSYHEGEEQKGPKKAKKVNKTQRKHRSSRMYGKREWSVEGTLQR